MKGAEALSQSTEVQTLVREYYEGNKIVAMICAGASPDAEATRTSKRHLGTLAAKTAGLPPQPVTSHPVIKNDLVSGKRTRDGEEDRLDTRFFGSV